MHHFIFVLTYGEILSFRCPIICPLTVYQTGVPFSSGTFRRKPVLWKHCLHEVTLLELGMCRPSALYRCTVYLRKAGECKSAGSFPSDMVSSSGAWLCCFFLSSPPGGCFMGRMWWKGCFISLAVVTFHQWPSLLGMWLIHSEREEQCLLLTLCLMPKHLGLHKCCTEWGCQSLLSCLQRNSVMKGQLNASVPLENICYLQVCRIIHYKKASPDGLTRWFFVFFLVLLQHPALSDDLETEMNGWQEPIQSPAPNLSSSVYEIVTVESLTVLDMSCAGQWSYWLLELPNSHSTAVSCLVSLCYLSSWCSLQSSLQPTQGLALCVSVCLFLIPFQGGLIWLFSISAFHAQILPATTWVAWVLNSACLQDRTWRVTYLMRTRRFLLEYFKIGDKSSACCDVAVGATACHVPPGVRLFCSAQALTAHPCGDVVLPAGLSYLLVCHSGSRMKPRECLFPWLGRGCCSADTSPSCPAECMGSPQALCVSGWQGCVCP